MSAVYQEFPLHERDDIEGSAHTLSVQTSYKDEHAAFLGLQDEGHEEFGLAWLTPRQTEELRDKLTEILGDNRDKDPDALHSEEPQSILSPVVEARLGVVRQLVDLGVEAGEIPRLLAAVAGELPGRDPLDDVRAFYRAAAGHAPDVSAAVDRAFDRLRREKRAGTSWG